MVLIKQKPRQSKKKMSWEMEFPISRMRATPSSQERCAVRIGSEWSCYITAWKPDDPAGGRVAVCLCARNTSET